MPRSICYSDSGQDPTRSVSWLRRRDEEIIGYCQQRRERFGPFGVDPAQRGQGIGRLLLFRCLDAMLARGFHCAWFLWTGRNAARLYELAGFRKVRQFAILQLSIA